MDSISRRRTLLCVQPDQDSRDALAKILRAYDCVFACSAYEALRNFHASSFDAYLLDFWLPDWSGPPLCREIRKLDPHSPVVFCTAAIGDRDEKRAFRAGASAYLHKPLDAAALSSTLRKLLARCDTRSLQAKSEAERAVQEALHRRAAVAAARPSPEGIMKSLERVARAQAYKAFIDSGGTRAHFEHWWPQLFGSARANYSFA